MEPRKLYPSDVSEDELAFVALYLLLGQGRHQAAALPAARGLSRPALHCEDGRPVALDAALPASPGPARRRDTEARTSNGDDSSPVVKAKPIHRGRGRDACTEGSEGEAPSAPPTICSFYAALRTNTTRSAALSALITRWTTIVAGSVVGPARRLSTAAAITNTRPPTADTSSRSGV